MKQQLLTFYELTPEELAAIVGKSTSDAAGSKSGTPQINFGRKVSVIEKNSCLDRKTDKTIRDLENIFENIAADTTDMPFISKLARESQNRAAESSSPTMSELSERVKAVQKEVDGLSFGQSMPTVQPPQKETHYDIKAFRRCRFGAVIFLIIQMVIAGLLIFLHNGLNESGTAYKAVFIILLSFYWISPCFYQLFVPDSLEKEKSEKLGNMNDICFYIGADNVIGALVCGSLAQVINLNLGVLLTISTIFLVCVGFFQTIKILIAINEQVKFHK